MNAAEVLDLSGATSVANFDLIDKASISIISDADIEGGLVELGTADTSSAVLNNYSARIQVSFPNSSSQGEAPKQSRLENYVYNILMEYPEGELQIKFFDFEKNKENRQKLLEKKGRLFFSNSTVAKLIILHEIRRTRCWSISPDRFVALSESCEQLFEGTLKQGYYTKSIPTHSATGSLQRQYDTLREKAVAINVIPPARLLKRKEFEEEDYSRHFEELKQSVNIIDDLYKSKWNSTAVQERQIFYKNNDESTIFATFPNLANPAGYILVQEDFCTFFNKPNDLFERNWPSIAKKIVQLAQSKKRDSLIKNILNSNASCLKEDNIPILALKLLPYLFKKLVKQTTKSTGQKNWYPEKEQVEKSFLLHIQDSAKFNILLEGEQIRLKQLHLDHKLIVRPYVVICGEDLSKITSSFVVVGTCIYQVASPTQAVDICLKFVQVFFKTFSPICSHIWQFILRQVYNFDVPHIYKGVVDLIENLQKI